MTRRRVQARTLQCVCKTSLRFAAGDTEVKCGECGRRFRLETRTRARGTRLQRGIAAALRGALAKMPNACGSCNGTGIRAPVAAERAAAAAAARGAKPPATKPCTRCGGAGVKGGA